MKKRIVAAIMCMCLCVGLSSNVMAASLELNATDALEVLEDGIQPRAAECGNCGTYFLNTSVSYGSWEDIGTQQCSKYGNRLDIIQTRQVYTTYKCSHCGYTQMVTSSETRVYCNH